MVTMFIRHSVTDFAKWKQVYDGLGAMQQSLGVKGNAVYCAADNANDVTVTHDFGSLAEAQAFAGSEQLHTAMAQAGVAGAPTVWFTTKV